MPYQRKFWIEGRRLVPMNSLFDEVIADNYCSGIQCYCCSGYFRFGASRVVKNRLDIRSRRSHWYKKRFPKLWRKEYAAEGLRYKLRLPPEVRQMVKTQLAVR